MTACHVHLKVFFCVCCLIDQLHVQRSAVAEMGSTKSQGSCLCEVRCERALIINRAESETYTAYIIEEHIVKGEVGLKHAISLA